MILVDNISWIKLSPTLTTKKMMFPSFSAILVLSTLAYSSYAVPILSSSNVVPWSILKWPSYPKAEVKVLEQVAAQASKLILDSMLSK